MYGMTDEDAVMRALEEIETAYQRLRENPDLEEPMYFDCQGQPISLDDAVKRTINREEKP
jgi:hypothetical protein